MTDNLLELEHLLPELPAAIERRRIGENLGKTATALQDAPRQIQRLTDVLTISRETGFDTDPSQAEAVKELITTAKDAATTMQEAQTADHLREVQDTYKDFVTALMNVDRQLRPHWRRIVQRDFTPLSAIGTLLERIDKTSELGRRLTTCGSEAEQLGDRIPVETLRKAIQRLGKERAILEIERASVTKEPEVDIFLNALAEGHATLRMVTDRVHSWLEQYDSLDSFAITPRS
jgi:hypothetical protein